MNTRLVMVITTLMLLICEGVSAKEVADTVSVNARIINNDTISNRKEEIKELKEVVIEGERRIAITDGVAFLPDKRAKQLAVDAISLISHMNLNELMYDASTNKILPLSGEEIAYYIDGMKASDRDLKALNTRDVLRVEYLQQPSDIRYGGNSEVVNFVLRHYTAGGVTKVGADQKLAGWAGDYYVSQRLEYKRMTYDVFFGGGYQNSKTTGTEVTRLYRDIDYNGIGYDEVLNNQVFVNSTRKTRKLGSEFKATYKNKKVTNQTKLSWEWNGGPGSISGVETNYIPQIITSSFYESRNRGLSVNPSFSNTTYIDLPKKQQLSLYFSTQYGHFNSRSFYALEDMPEILNSSISDQYSYFISLEYSKQIKKHNFSIDFYDTGSYSRIRYGGSYDGVSRLHSHGDGINFSYSYSWKKGRINLISGLVISRSSVAGISTVNLTPRFNLYLSQEAGKVGSFTLRGQMQNVNFMQSAYNDIIIRTTDLTWLKGNPYLKPRIYTTLTLTHSKRFNKNFSIGASLWYHNITRKDVYLWFTEKGYDGVIRQTNGQNSLNEFSISLRPSLRLLNRKLYLSGSVSWEFSRLSGLYHITDNYFNGDLSATYYLKNVFFALSFSPGSSNYTQSSGIQKVTTPISYGLRTGWGHNNWSITLNMRNMFRFSHCGMYTQTISDHYSEWSRDVARSYGPQFNLNITYTIGYGKKISNDDMMESTSGGMTNNAMGTSN